MAASPTVEETIPLGDTANLYHGTATLGTYATGGVAFDISGNERLSRCFVQGGGYVYEWVPSSQLLKVFRQKDPANAGGADIPLPEVANGVDLSGVTVGFIAIGQ